ncbi:MAG: hypothetical protein EOP85_02365 [Verrucomicrobiaceae bacterium]|nr:MAG: hypothetical protein EOP85_02365 [Verrucomicrobiaceae bacterium]
MLAKVKAENKDIGERALLCACILHALSESGHVDEAWKLLEESPGSVRVMEIGMLFQTDKLPLETLLTRLRELTDPDDRTNAIRAILSSRSASIAQLDFNTFPLESESDQRAAFGAFVSVLHGAAGEKDVATSEAVLGKLVDLVGTGKIDGKHLYVVLDGDYGVDPFRKWEMLRPVEGGMSPADSERFRVQGVTSMVRADMDKAMELLCSDPQSRYSVPILNKAISTIYQLDPAHANKWMTENLSRIDPATGQRVIVSVGQAAIRSGELATARQWAEHLLNPGVKEQLLKQIDAAEVPAADGSR